jgi:hypothetical protein
MCSWRAVTKEEIGEDLANWVKSPAGTYPEIDNYADTLGGTAWREVKKEAAAATTREFKQFTSNIQANKELVNSTIDTWSNLSNQEKSSLYSYTIGSDSINMQLRGLLKKYNPTAAREADLMKSAIDKSVINSDIVVNRSIGNPGIAKLLGVDSVESINESLLGKVVTDDGFTSTSAGEAIWDFANSKFTLEIKVPKGTKGIYSEPFAYYGGGRQKKVCGWDGANKFLSSSSEEQMEVILQSGTSFRVNAIEKGEKISKIILEVVAQGGKSIV